MTYTFEPVDVRVEAYNKCTFTFMDDSEIVWGTEERPAVTDLSRANMEYDSPLYRGTFPWKEGLFASTGYLVVNPSNPELDATIRVDKVFKPFQCRKIFLEGIYHTYDADGTAQEHPAECTITFDDEEIYVCGLIDLVASEEIGSNSLEFQRHLRNSDEYTQPITQRGSLSFKPHEQQINGSNFNIAFNDLLDSIGRQKYVNEAGRQVREYMNFALLRNGSKFFIGGYLRNGN